MSIKWTPQIYLWRHVFLIKRFVLIKICGLNIKITWYIPIFHMAEI